MTFKQKISSAKWIQILIFYILACLLTFIFTKFPNFIKNLWISIFSLEAPFSWNHGIGLLLATLLCYLIFKGNNRTSILGSKPVKSLLIAALYLIFYSVFGLSNNFGINQHVWALIFCSSMLVYNIFEETAWRGFLHDRLAKVPTWLKGIITGILWGVWHIFIFENFNQFGGLQNFVMLTILVSIIMAYAVKKTNSILVAASIHGLMILRNNYVTIICLVLWTVLIITWEKDNLMIRRKTAYNNV
ncbi:CPBP family intramembrane metalloprotease [Gramella jeungdoensis]|uniref:CPBP family intramembrane metalloprotease n=1 Tax=Gramella jeungdoensis TaxID=708091 RepID=A0ABT0Z286_9FLAO|nr:CPBP family intramembrane glutamic endopeptidase [Gramella jeungdoensis]MCM8569851.1 CPBP family intramembrane metalloprotease [Gramella jeungdoensis]